MTNTVSYDIYGVHASENDKENDTGDIARGTLCIYTVRARFTDRWQPLVRYRRDELYNYTALTAVAPGNRYGGGGPFINPRLTYPYTLSVVVFVYDLVGRRRRRWRHATCHPPPHAACFQPLSATTTDAAGHVYCYYCCVPLLQLRVQGARSSSHTAPDDFGAYTCYLYCIIHLSTPESSPDIGCRSPDMIP